MTIRPYLPEDKEEVITLWSECGLTRSWNNPEEDIRRKLEVNPELFLVGKVNEKIVAAVMGGYEGHRGWVNYLAVKPSHQKKGLGRQIMEAVEIKLSEIGCPKINLQVRSDNSEVIEFYKNIGYEVEDRVSMGKRLVED